MRHATHIFITACVVLLLPILGHAQRQVSPVVSDDQKPPTPTMHYYDKHGKPLQEPVMFLATLDTVPSASVSAKPIYPRIYDIELGLNFMDGILAIAGQKYGGADVHASLNMWNWLLPTVEVGIGGGRFTPSAAHYTYHGKPALYAKIGADYNFLYKSNPQYKLLVGLRAGFSPYSYSISDIKVSDEQGSLTSLPDISALTATSFYGEVLAGIRVSLYKQISMGWSLRYRFMFRSGGHDEYPPAFIPGYGGRDNHLGATLSVYYTLPLAKDTPVADDGSKEF